MTRGRAIDTRLQHPRVGRAPGGEPVSPPIYQSSTYVLPTPELGAEIAASWHPQRFYTRYGSPNVAQVEALVAELEGAESAVAVGSGMAAISAAILAHVRAGDHVVAQTAHYTAALSLFADWLPRQGVEVTQVAQTDLDAFRGAIGPKTRLVYTESPTNPTMALTDLKAVAALAHAHRAIVVTDNTFASSFNQLPLTLGVDLVVHSATKYLNGHSDVTAGVVAGPRKLIEPVWEYARVHGPVLHPMEAWLLGRGLKTYALRMRRTINRELSSPKRLRKRAGSRGSTIPASPRTPSTNSAAGKCRAALAACCRSRSWAQRPNNASSGLRPCCGMCGYALRRPASAGRRL